MGIPLDLSTGTGWRFPTSRWKIVPFCSCSQRGVPFWEGNSLVAAAKCLIALMGWTESREESRSCGMEPVQNLWITCVFPMYFELLSSTNQIIVCHWLIDGLAQESLKHEATSRAVAAKPLISSSGILRTISNHYIDYYVYNIVLYIYIYYLFMHCRGLYDTNHEFCGFSHFNGESTTAHIGHRPPWLPAAQRPGPEAPGARQRGQRCHGAFGFQVLEGEHNGSLVNNGKSLGNNG